MARAICPDCKGSMNLDEDIEVGEYLNCPQCAADLEVISLRPLAVDWAEDEIESPAGSWTWSGSKREKSKQDTRKKKRSHFKYSDDAFTTDR